MMKMDYMILIIVKLINNSKKKKEIMMRNRLLILGIIILSSVNFFSKWVDFRDKLIDTVKESIENSQGDS